MLEVAVALGLLTVAVVALAQLVLASGAAGQDTRRSDLASVLAQERVEQLRALSWGYEADGAPREDTSGGTGTAGEPGMGVGVSPPDALVRDTPGFVDYVDDSGRLVPAAGGAAFVRRWLVAPSLDGPGEALVVRVLVIRREFRLDGSPERSRGAALLTTVRTRRTW